MPRTDFNDLQRAEIFVLDRATCSYSGRSLWIADYGNDPGYAIDWADHIVPASRGGKSIIENGASASWLYNSLRGNARQRLVFFHRGVPTAEHALHIGVIDPAVTANLQRFRKLHISDWFLNRAMWHLWIGITFEYHRQQGFKRSRDYEYYAGAAQKCLKKWRGLVEADSVTSIEQRELAPENLEMDQQQLLSIRQSSSTGELVSTMKDLFPSYNATATIIYALGEANTVKKIESIMKRIERQKRISPRMHSRLLAYAKSRSKLVS